MKKPLLILAFVSAAMVHAEMSGTVFDAAAAGKGVGR